MISGLLASIVVGLAVNSSTPDHAPMDPLAKAPDPRRHISEYAYDDWGIDDGLPQNSVLSMVQDRDGYLWIATYEGVARFDGVDFELIRPEGFPGMHRGTTSLLADPDGTLWIATQSKGIFRMAADGGITHYGQAQGLADIVWSLNRGPDGTLWAGTVRGLCRLVEQRFECLDNLPQRPVGDIAWTPDGALWVGTRDAGLIRMHRGEIDNWLELDGVESVHVRALEVGQDGELWIGTYGSGLFRYEDGNFTRWSEEDGLASDLINTLYMDALGTLWIGTYGFGLNRLVNGRIELLNAEAGLPNSHIQTVMVDQEGSLWFGSSGGLHRLRTAKFITLSTREGLATRFVRVTAQDLSGEVWVGTDSAGLSRIRDGRVVGNIGTPPLLSESVRALWPASTGGMWVGAWGGGVTRIDPDGSTLSYSVASGHLIDNQVRAMLEDSRGDLWIGTERRGITHIAGEDVTHYTVDNSVLLSSDIRSIAEAPDGSIWFGTYGRGLVRYRDNVLERFDLMERGIIFSIAFEPDGSAWVGTEDSLFRLTGESAMRVPIEPKVAVFHALDDGMGRLWLCTNFGILAIDRESALAATGSIDAELFDADHGLRSRQCNGASQPAGWKSDEGVLWFPTADGVTRVDPGDMPKNERAPPVVVEEVIVDGRSMRIGGGTLEIAPGSRLIEIDYAALTFIAPTKVRYQYRLFGQDRDWVEAGSRRHAFYNNLPPGSYEFQVRAANADGVWNRDGAALKLRQLPEVHQTWWFRAGATAFIVALILATWRWRSADLRRQNVHLESTVAKRTEELEKTNSELEGTLLKLTTTQAQLVEAEKMAALGALVAGVAHEINTPVGNGITIASHLKDRIEQIRASVPPDMSGRIAPVEDGLGMIEANLQRTRKIVTSFKRAAVDKDRAQRRTFQLSRVLNRERLLFAHPIEAGGHSLKVELEDDPQLDSYPDPLFDTLGNLIQNSLVHGFEQDQQGTIRIVASLRGERLELIVEDDGRGIPLENRKTVFDPFVTRHRGRHAGLGLHIVYNTVTWLLGGDVECLEKERGARFRIIIPLSAPE